MQVHTQRHTIATKTCIWYWKQRCEAQKSFSSPTQRGVKEKLQLKEKSEKTEVITSSPYMQNKLQQLTSTPKKPRTSPKPKESATKNKRKQKKPSITVSQSNKNILCK